MTRLYGFSDPAEQAAMVLDRVRIDAYARAIAAVVRPGDVVLDVGSGSGVLALLAAKAGARKVYAVERTGVIELVRLHAQANGFGDVVEPIHADLADLTTLPERPRVVLAELLGHFAPAEQAHRAYRLARRLAAEGAVLIPGGYRIMFAAARPPLTPMSRHRLVTRRRARSSKPGWTAISDMGVIFRGKHAI